MYRRVDRVAEYIVASQNSGTLPPVIGQQDTIVAKRTHLTAVFTAFTLFSRVGSSIKRSLDLWLNMQELYH